MIPNILPQSLNIKLKPIIRSIKYENYLTLSTTLTKIAMQKNKIIEALVKAKNSVILSI